MTLDLAMRALLEGWQDLPEDEQRTVAWLVVATLRVRDPNTPERERRELRARLEEMSK